MIDIVLLVLTLILVALTFYMQSKYDLRKRREERSRERLAALREGNLEEETKELIGEEAYERMTVMIEEVLNKHRGQSCIALDLTCGPNSKTGSKELHSLLPGMELNLVMCSEGGVECIDVYHNGIRVGRLALTQAEIAKETLNHNYIRGVYVAEQNCYGLEDRLQLSIIIFYEPQSKPHMSKEFAGLYKFSTKKEDINPSDVCQN